MPKKPINPEIVVTALNRIKYYANNALDISNKANELVGKVKEESPEHKVITLKELTDGMVHNISKLKETLNFIKQYIVEGNLDELRAVQYTKDPEKLDE